MRGSSMPLSQDAPRSSAVPPEVERSVCVVMHDVTGFTWPDCEKLLDALRADLAEAMINLHKRM